MREIRKGNIDQIKEYKILERDFDAEKSRAEVFFSSKSIRNLPAENDRLASGTRQTGSAGAAYAGVPPRETGVSSYGAQSFGHNDSERFFMAV